MTEPITPERLAEIEAGAAAATPGPWRATRLGGHGSGGNMIFWAVEPPASEVMTFSGREHNARFSAAARDDVPALCAALREAWRERDEEQQDKHEALATLRRMEELAQIAREEIGRLAVSVEALLAERDALQAACAAMREALWRKCDGENCLKHATTTVSWSDRKLEVCDEHVNYGRQWAANDGPGDRTDNPIVHERSIRPHPALNSGAGTALLTERDALLAEVERLRARLTEPKEPA